VVFYDGFDDKTIQADSGVGQENGLSLVSREIRELCGWKTTRNARNTKFL
jgi:hypothetical protein